ncbi:UTP--glucose-1-phosphate uridylyltransferase [Akkermansiaceae bacterium]|nr:UTP--glucose-1-phosphate uridylyltransferase [Akkermansiaceae bacterium]
MTETANRIRQKMEEKGVMNSAILAFVRAFELIASGSSGEVSESEITPAQSVADYEELEREDSFDPELLAKTVVIKLNGGLGTSMGLEKVKSLLEVRRTGHRPRLRFTPGLSGSADFPDWRNHSQPRGQPPTFGHGHRLPPLEGTHGRIR